MSMEEKPFTIERARSGRAKCKNCKVPIEKATLRIGKIGSNPFGDGLLTSWYHVDCLFRVFAKQRATTKRIDQPEEDIAGWADISAEDRQQILEKLGETGKGTTKAPGPAGGEVKNSRPTEVSPATPPKKKKKKTETCGVSAEGGRTSGSKPPSRDDAFEEFQLLCAKVAKADAYLEKTAIIKRMLTRGSSGGGFQGDPKLWCKLLLPSVAKRVYNLQSKQLIKLFARILLQDEKEMLQHLQQGDVAETISLFYEKSTAVDHPRISKLTLHQVDQFLEQLTYLTKEDEQIRHFKTILVECTQSDLRMLIRLIKCDLRINAGPKHVLAAIHRDAYEAFRTSRDLNAVIDRCLGSDSNINPISEDEKPLIRASTSGQSSTDSSTDLSNTNRIVLTPMTPVLPMLAEACKSVEFAMTKCPNGMLSEIKYDGERVQIHKKGSEFRYFSRSLKPVLEHKVRHLKTDIPRAFPDGDDLILDSEILLIDTTTGRPLPFGTLGVHKRSEFKNANVCLYVFDCIYYNGQVLLHETIQERRKILEERMTVVPNRVVLSEVEFINNPKQLADMIRKVLGMHLEGLVLKDVNSTYEPGMRRWLKIKKDYLLDGAMADSADLVVLGAWYGTGNKGGMMSVFLMGCYDEDRDCWLTVTKVHTGHTDAALARLQTELKMTKIDQDPSKLPAWLIANKPMIPDFVANDPKAQPVWEVTGAEFTNQGVHTADSISIRFPRVTRIRRDKDWATATTLRQLRDLFQKSQESENFDLLASTDSSVIDNPAPVVPNVPLRKQNEDAKMMKRKRNAVSKSETKRRTVSSPKISSETERAVKQETKRQSIDSIGTGSDSNDEDNEKDDSRRAEYFAFIENDYIEYTNNASPLNWIDGRKPPKVLPSNAQPIYTLTDSEMRSRAIFPDVRASVAPGVEATQRQKVQRTLRTLGGIVLGKKRLMEVTHVIHCCRKIPWRSVKETFADYPKTVKHVHYSWLEDCAIRSKALPLESYAVELVMSDE